jgi:6-phosphogluconolactonase
VTARTGRAEIRVLDDAETVSREAAAEFARLAREGIAARGRFAVALAGGSTPRRLYELLAEPPHRDALDWKRVEFFWGDERAVPPEHGDSNYGMAVGALLGKIAVPAARVHRIEGERSDRDAAARDYEAEIGRVLGATPGGVPPAFDLILLGMGADGHTASLFPGTRALGERQRWVVANPVEKLATERITLTAPIINRAREIRVVTAGAEKAPALRAVLEGPRDPDRLPSQLLAPEAGRLVWIVDRAAAAELARSGGRPS